MYTPITYKVTFLEDDGSLAGELQGTKGQSIFVPAAKPKKDYEFTHWQEEGGTQTIQKGTNYYTVTKTITFKATYTPIIYTIIFLGDNNQEVNRTNASAGTVITVPQAPTLPNYTFTSWIEVGGTERIDKSTTTYKITRAVTFKAQYTAIIYTATFLNESGGPVATRTGAYGAVITPPDAPIKTGGYTFTQWKEVGGTVTIPSGTNTYTLMRDITFKAEYVDSFDGTHIYTQDDLNKVRNNLKGNYILMNDIALTDNDGGYDVNGWIPIGSDYPNQFTGTFDGNGHRITGLWIDRPTVNLVGLFAHIDGNATIKNLGVEISSRGVRGYENVGGIAGHVSGGTITNSYSTGSVSGNGSVRRNVGGIAGTVLGNGTITNSYSTANVSNSNHVGGIVGTVILGGTITNSYSTGSINGGGVNIGGIAGEFNGGLITNSAAISPLVAGSSNVNRIAGIFAIGTASNNFALNTMAVYGNRNGTAGTDKTIAQLKTQSTYSNPVNGDGRDGLGWKFGNDDANPWKIDPYKNNGLPYLYWENR
jgi:hypothetical protein